MVHHRKSEQKCPEKAQTLDLLDKDYYSIDLNILKELKETMDK